VNFTDLTQGSVNARLWDFGDGAFSIAQNPSHTFMSAGVFDVSLTAMNLAGVDVETKLDLVTVTAPGGPDAPTPDFTQDRTAGNAPLTVNFTDLSTGDVSSWLWSFGDGGTSTAQNPSHVYASAGSYDVALTASGPGGSNALTKLDAVLVNELGGVDIDFQANPRTGPAPLNVRFRTQVLAGQGTGITGTWHFGDGTTAPANGQPIFHLYTNPGLYTVTLIGTNGVDTDIEQKVNFINVTAPLLPDPHSILKK
jgi:PKD repeat protein